MRGMRIANVPQNGVTNIYRYVFPREMQREMNEDFYSPNIGRHFPPSNIGMPDDSVIRETQEWVRENLTTESVMTRLFDRYVVNTTDDDDLAFLTLQYGISEP